MLDLGTRIAAPFCAGLLGEQGAEVIKIEQPGARRLHARDRPVRRRTGYSLFWAVEGRGRKSVTLDLRTPEGQDLFRRLAATADVVVENFRPGTLERWNIAPGDLDPRLVIVRISMFGQDGPYSERPGLDRVGIGYGGLLHLTGYPDRPPVRVGVTISDYLTGVFAAQAAVAALYARDARRDGQGAVIDAALYGVGAAHPRVDARRLRPARHRPRRARATGSPTRRRSTTTPPPTASTSASSPAPTPTSRRLCKAMERPDLLDDPRFAKLADRAAHGDEINGIVADWTATLDRPPRSRSAASRTTCRSPPRTPRPTSSPTRT